MSHPAMGPFGVRDVREGPTCAVTLADGHQAQLAPRDPREGCRSAGRLCGSWGAVGCASCGADEVEERFFTLGHSEIAMMTVESERRSRYTTAEDSAVLSTTP